ncbi:hypothetical protein [Colwellia sp. RSH04]|uniref:hypothetical protein n=1 Tax=Colwellia sp. RSH04 TaxID=2305464 RepID=UPI000E576798|nr:hypothetical protein [Colwellia sp. RSH04]RHW76801.1 hypothetical protein D1094_06875 [Colwellia sp. RSH04]
MNQLDSDKLENIMNLLEGDNQDVLRKMTLEWFIDKAINSPKDVDPETVFFIGKLLERLKNANYENPRKAMGISSVRGELSAKTKIEKIRLISDVNFLYNNNGCKGAQGALELLFEKSSYYKHYKNINSLQVTYRNAIKEMEKWSSQDEDMYQEIKGKDAVLKGQSLMKVLHVLVGERNPLI